MSYAISRRLGRRFTAMGAGAALVAAGLSLGVMAPANAASVVTGGATDAFGNPVSGVVVAYLQDPDSGTFSSEGTFGVSNDGYIEGTLEEDGVYKFRFSTTFGSYSEYYKDKADLATADAVTVAGGAPVALGAWTIDQPYVLGTVSNAAGKPLPGASVSVFDAASGDPIGGTNADEKGAFKVPTQSEPVKVSIVAGDYALEYYADAADLASAYPISATATGANLGNIVLAPAGSISGQVTSDAGAPLEFIRVEIDNNHYDYTDKNGVYTIKNAPTGQQIVEFSDPIGEYSFEYFNNVTDEDLATPVTVGVGQAVGSVNAALTPRPWDPSTTVEVTGAVKDNLGAPVVGALITASGTPASSTDREIFEYTYSNRQGNYAFTELEKVQGENQFKLNAGSADQGIISGLIEQGDDNAFALFGAWYGGGQDYDRAPAVTVTPGTPVGGVDFSLERAGGIAGSVTGVAGAPLSPAVNAFGPKDGQYAPLFVDVEPDSTFESLSLRAGTYKIRFDDSSGFHAGEWWKDKSQLDDAVLVTVKSGQLVGGLNAVLGNQLTASERPTTSSVYAWVGKAITADPGSWNLQTGTAFNYEWLVGSTVVGKGETFTPTTAQIGDRLTLRVTAENGKLLGTALSAATSKVGYQPKIKVKIKGDKASLKVKASPVKAKKVKGSVVVKEIVKVKDDGTIKYKKVAKTKIKKGKGTVSLSKLKKGKHKLVFFFTGKGQVGSNDVAKKVKVKR